MVVEVRLGADLVHSRSHRHHALDTVAVAKDLCDTSQVYVAQLQETAQVERRTDEVSREL